MTTTRHSRRRLVRRLRASGLTVNAPRNPMLIWAEIGPPPRQARDPEFMARLRSYFAVHQDSILARAEPGWRPWAWWVWASEAPDEFRNAGPLQTPEQTAWLADNVPEEGTWLTPPISSTTHATAS